MAYKAPLILALQAKQRGRLVLKNKFKAGGITKEELAKRCLDLTKKHS